MIKFQIQIQTHNSQFENSNFELRLTSFLLNKQNPELRDLLINTGMGNAAGLAHQHPTAIS